MRVGGTEWRISLDWPPHKHRRGWLVQVHTSHRQYRGTVWRRTTPRDSTRRLGQRSARAFATVFVCARCAAGCGDDKRSQRKRTTAMRVRHAPCSEEANGAKVYSGLSR